MNIISKTENQIRPKTNLNDLLAFKNDTEEVSHEAQILMFKFLSEIERLQESRGLNRKSLAEAIKTSGSYLTQVFRGDKPLNFITLAKIQKVLNIKFNIKAIHNQSHQSITMPEILYKNETFKVHNLGEFTVLHKEQYVLLKGAEAPVESLNNITPKKLH